MPLAVTHGELVSSGGVTSAAPDIIDVDLHERESRLSIDAEVGTVTW